MENASETKECKAYLDFGKEAIVSENGIVNLPVDVFRAFHDHPFHLYEGERLQDMVDSICEYGVLNSVIVRKVDGGYEMLSRHNRQNAAKLAGLKGDCSF